MGSKGTVGWIAAPWGSCPETMTLWQRTESEERRQARLRAKVVGERPARAKVLRLHRSGRRVSI